MAQEGESSTGRSGLPKGAGYVQLALILAAIGVALYFAQAPSQTEREAISDMAPDLARPAVTVIEPAPTEQALTVRLTGGVTLHGNVRVTSEVEGRVVWVSPNFRNGGSISADEVFIRIDPTEHALQRDAAAAAVSEAEARVRVEKALGEESAAAFARENPGADIPEGIRRAPQIAQAEAAFTKAGAELKLAQLQLERTEISLPYDIRVMAADIDVGQFVGPAELVGRAASLGSVYRTDALQVRAPVEQDDLAYLAPVIGRSATVRTAAGTYAAEVERRSAIIAPKTRLATLFLKFAEGQPGDTLPLPGTFVEVSIAGPVHGNAFVLPESALQDRDSVWVVAGGALQAVAPRVLGYAEGGVVVEAFDAGDGIVVDSLPAAREGLAVEVSAAPTSE